MKDLEKKGTEEEIVPDHHEGQSLTVQSSSVLEDTDASKMAYLKARARLLDVNHWHHYTEGITATFQLVDKDGRKLDGKAEQDLLIRIDIPGPGPVAGHGYDWVLIEELEEGHSEEMEYVAFRVRPSQNPESGEKEIAHFYSEESTGTLTLKRENEKLTCTIYDRNLKANDDESQSLPDAMRNRVVGNMAAMGLSRIQWQSLANSILDL